LIRQLKIQRQAGELTFLAAAGGIAAALIVKQIQPVTNTFAIIKRTA
jgi:hypothetical protein